MALQLDNATLQAALVGYQQQLEQIESKMEELRRKLGKTSSPRPTAAPRKAAPRKHRMSAEAARELDSAQYFASLMEAVHPDTAFRDRASALIRKTSDTARALSLTRDVYNALAALKLDNVDAATRHYVERQLVQFRRAGV